MRVTLITYFLTIVLSIVFDIHSYARYSVNIDSLTIELNEARADSSKLKILSQLFWAHQRSNPDEAIIYAEQALEISKANDYTVNIAQSLRSIGIIKKRQSDFKTALSLFEESKNYYTKINDTAGIYTCLIDIGDVYYRQNNYMLALKYLNAAREIIIQSGNIHSLSRIYHKLGGIYNKQKQYDKAIEYHQKSLEINLDLDFKLGISVNYNNIGNACLELNQYSKAMDNYLKALVIKKELNDKKGIARTLNNIGLVFVRQKEFQQAITYHKQALDGYKELNNKRGIALCLCNLGNDNLETNNLPLAIEYAQNSLKISEDINSLLLQKKNYWTLSEANAKQNQFKNSRRYLKLYMLYNDSIVSAETVREIAEMEAKFEVAKKEKEIVLLNSEKEKQNLQIEKQYLQRNMMIGMIILVLSVLFFLLWSYRNKQKLNKKLAELNLTKSRFFANISHEFRTPLTLLLGPLEKLLNNPKQEEKEMIRLMHRNASRLLFLDNQLLDLAKLESGKLKLEVRKYDIIQALKGMSMSFESLAVRRKISFQCIFPEDKTDAFFDKDKLEKIVYNLLSNALKFTPENGEVVFGASIISDKTKLPQKFKNKPAETIFISVHDTGQGISKGQQEFVFDRFYQVDSGINRNFEGTGLGLSLTKELVELHHGVILLESEPGKGSTFKVYLPIDKNAYSTNEIIEDRKEDSTISIRTVGIDTENKLESSDIGESIVQESPEGGLIQILIVEDNQDMRAYIRDCFTGQYTILEAKDGVDGLITATDKIPDIIITDLMMPRMDGIELCQKLKTDERSSHIPVILLTALSSVEDRIRGLETGADDYIAKPFNRQELLTRVHNLTQQRKMLRERFGKEIRIQAKDITVTSADELFLNKLIVLTEKNIANPDLNVDSLLEEIHLSRSQLHRKLKALTDLSATEFIRNIRLKRAAQLLEQNHGSISETVYAVGFSSLSYFSKCFQKQFGVSPKEFIERTS